MVLYAKEGGSKGGRRGRTAHPLGRRNLVLLRCRRLGLGGEGGLATLILDADRACAHLSGAARHTAREVAL